MNLIDKLPYFYDNGYTRPIIEAEQEERDTLLEEIKDTLRQCFVSTATWGLDYWERMLYLPTNTGKTYEERRNIIYARMRATRTTTVEVVRQLASVFFNSENVIVTEYNDKYLFHIEFENIYSKFDGDSINTNYIDDAIVDYAVAGDEEIIVNCSDVEKVIDIYKPAHLNYAFVFTLKDKAEINSSMKNGHSTLPICNITKVGTWWKSFGEGSLNKSKVIKAKTHTGYSKLAICGLYKHVTKSKQIEESISTSSAIIGIARIGSAVIGGE